MGDDAASARLFIRQMGAFVEDVLGIDPVTKKRMEFRGLLGDVRAYFGMIETQGRGTLHGHFLIWLAGFPPNTKSFDELVARDGEEFLANVTKYAESVMTNELPLSPDSGNCVNCGELFDSLVPLPIPVETHKNVIGKCTQKHILRTIREPLLVRCGRCQSKFSSQHVLRRMVLLNRPIIWPPPLRQLSRDEIIQQLKKEAASRITLNEAWNIVNERESIQFAVSANVSDNTGSSVLRDFNEMKLAALHYQNVVQAPYSRLDEDPFLNDEIISILETMPPSPNDNRLSSQDNDFMVSALALRFNQHWWSHTSSCFKASKSTGSSNCCRYMFPREREAYSRFDSDGFHLRRAVGYEYMNGFNPTIMETFRCNHDIQLLLGGAGAMDRIYYVCKYVTKAQKQIDSMAAIALAAFQRREEREERSKQDGIIDDKIVAGRKRVTSVAFNITNRQEIAGPLAVLDLLRGSCCYKSNECCRLPLFEVLKQLKGEDYGCRLVLANGEDSSSFRTVSVLDDYLYRPDYCEEASLYEFAARYIRKRKSTGTANESCFRDGHPLQDTHCVGIHERERIPMITGFQIPAWKDSGRADEKEKYACAVLALFHPFREITDLLGVHLNTTNGWIAAYLEWKDYRSGIAKEIMNNLDDYYAGKEKADEDSSCTSAVPFSQYDSDSDSSEEDGIFAAKSGSNLDFEGEDSEVYNGTSAFEQYGFGNDDTTVLESSSLNPAFCPTIRKPESQLERTMELCLHHDMFDGTLASVADSEDNNYPLGEHSRREDFNCQDEKSKLKTWIANNGLDVDKLRNWVADSNSDSTLHTRTAPLAKPSETQVIELLEDVLSSNYRTWTPCSADKNGGQSSSQYASLSEISRAFTLNEKQHVAFCIVGEALLKRWKLKEEYKMDGVPVQDLQDTQLLMFLGGEGGTGKSRVIEAIENLCCSWGHGPSLVKTALTGKATTVIRGRTLASFLLTLEQGLSPIDLESLDIIIVDEASMIKKMELAKLDKFLRKQKRMMAVPFGGVHILLTGDFLQLPPVGAEPLYVDPKMKRKWTSVDIAAFELWKTFETVVMLEESVRFRADLEWGEGCRAARLGNWSEEFISIINSRLVDHSTDAESAINIKEVANKQCVFTSPENGTRVAINNRFVVRAAAKLRPQRYPIRVVANFKGALQKLSRQEVDTVMSLPDSKFGRMAPFLDLILGMPVQITQNVRAAKGVANGTFGVLEDVIFKPSTKFRTVSDTTTGMLVSLPSESPVVAFIRITRGPGAIPISPTISSDIFPVFYSTEAYSKCNIKLAPAPNGNERALALKIQQFPFLCAVGSTVYKVQGETLNSMVVVDWKSRISFANKPQQNYLVVSRVTSRNALLTLKPFTRAIADWSKPPQEALDEEERLISLSRTTIHDFSL